MSWFQLVVLTCDEPAAEPADRCTNRWMSKVHREGLRVSRAKAAAEGWGTWLGGDRCPDHMPDIPGARRLPDATQTSHTGRETERVIKK